MSGDSRAKNRLGGITLLADWDEIALNGRKVYSVYDSDVATKPEVNQAVQRLTQHLQRRGADVYQGVIPSPTGTKVGVDDFLLEHSVDDLIALSKPVSVGEAPSPEREAKIEELVNAAINGQMVPKAAINKLRELRGHRHKIRAAISHIVMVTLRTKGVFIRAPENRYYFCSVIREVLALDCFAFGTLLSTLFGLNQTEPEFQYIVADANTEAHIRGTRTRVYQLAFYDKNRRVLYLDRFDGMVYRLDGHKIELVENGTDGILFSCWETWEPYEYLKGMRQVDLIAPTLIDDINFSADNSILTPDEQRFCLSLWLLSIFFEARQPTKPLLLFYGEKGGGKSTALRRIVKFLFGPRADLFTIEKDKEDAFIAVITSHYLAPFDQVDGHLGWLNDRLSSAATGGEIPRRKLYTTNELATYFPRCFIAMTSRLHRFKREDVADRLLILTVDRLNSFRSEEEMLTEVESKHNLL